MVSARSTYYRKKAYISIATAEAVSECGSAIGRKHPGSVLTLASSEIYSLLGYHDTNGYPFNFADVLPNVPAVAYNVGRFDCLSQGRKDIEVE